MAESLPQIGPSVSFGDRCSLVNSRSINFEGKTALCCNDFFASHGHESLAEMTVGELWERCRPIRKCIYLDYCDKPICQIYNFGG